MFFDSDDNLIAQGQAEPADKKGIWRIRLPSNVSEKMDVGPNSLEVAVRSKRVALPSFASFAFATVSEGEKKALQHGM